MDKSNSTKANSLARIEESLIKKEKKLRKIGYDYAREYFASYEEINNPDNIGKRYFISTETKSNLELLKAVINRIKERNCLLVERISNTDYFIVSDENDEKKMINKLKYPFDGKFITASEFSAE